MYSGLWRSFLEGDDTAFSLIYEKFFSKLYAYGLKLGFNEETCKDAIHDVFCHIFLSRKTLQHVDNIEFYLLQSIRNRLFDNYKKEKKIDNVELESTILDRDELIIERIIKNESELQIKETIEKLLRTLSPKQKKIIHYRYVLNLKYNEIAIIFDMSPDAVKKVVKRALKKMRDNSHDPKELFILILLSLIG